MSPRRANLFFNEVEVIEEPFPGRRDTAFCSDRGRQKLTGLDEEVFILSQAREKLVGTALPA